MKDQPLEPVGNVPDAKGYNFATGTCTMYQKGITADSDTADPNAVIKKGGSTNITNPAAMIFDNNNNNNNNFATGTEVTLVNGNPDGHNNGIIIEVNDDGTYEVEMQYPNDEGVVTLHHNEIRLNNNGGKKNTSRKRKHRKRTRKNKRKYKKSRTNRLPKLTRRTPYKKYS